MPHRTLFHHSSGRDYFLARGPVDDDFEVSFRHKFVGTGIEDIGFDGVARFPLYRETATEPGHTVGPDGVDPGPVALTSDDAGDAVAGALCTILGVSEAGVFQSEKDVAIDGDPTEKTFRGPLIEISLQGLPGLRPTSDGQPGSFDGNISAKIGTTLVGYVAQFQDQSFIGAREAQAGIELVVRRFKCGLVVDGGQGNSVAKVTVRLMHAPIDGPVVKRLGWPLGTGGYRDVPGLDEHIQPGEGWFLEGESDAAGAIIVGTVTQHDFKLHGLPRGP